MVTSRTGNTQVQVQVPIPGDKEDDDPGAPNREAIYVEPTNQKLPQLGE